MFGIGFDSLLDELNMFKKPNCNYPPYNIIKEAEDEYKIELALAGFSKKEIDVTHKDGYLYVSAFRESKTEDSKYCHRGISLKSFNRQFRLAEHIEVKSASYVNGILSIILIKNVPEEKKPQKVEIN